LGNAKVGAWALIVGASSYIALMAVHPSHVGEPVIGALSLSAIVHGAAFVMQPPLLFGFWALTRRMEHRSLAQIAFCFYALAAVLTMMAATMSGLVIPAILDAAHVRASGHGPPVDAEALRQTLQAQANYTVMLNRSFAAVHFSMFAVAMLLWSIAWPGRSVLILLTRAVGLVAGAGVVAWRSPAR
jgi:hypothetical protein